MMGFGAFHPRQTHQIRKTHLTSIPGAPGGRALPSFLHSGDVLRVVVLAVTVLGRPDAQEKLEGVA